MKELNKLERILLEKLSHECPVLLSHIPFLMVFDREITGVGMYVNFIYKDDIGRVPDLGFLNRALSTNENIEIQGLKYGLGYEVLVSEGRIKYIEFITYGESWDGHIGEFVFHKFD